MSARLLRRSLRRLRRDRRGVTIVEFAITAPVMCILIMGLGDILYQTYVQAILTGAMQKAGRDSAIQGGDERADELDKKVKDMVGTIAKTATFTPSRQTYTTFQSTKPENFTDSNGDGKYNKGECFTDINENDKWDADPSKKGQGGASDITLYTMTMTYDRVFPVAKMFGWSGTQTISASTLLKNQPYATQAGQTAKTIC